MDSFIYRDKSKLSADNLFLSRVFPVVWVALASLMGYLLFREGQVLWIVILPLIILGVLRIPRLFKTVDVFVDYEKSELIIQRLDESRVCKNFNELKSYNCTYNGMVSLFFKDGSKYYFQCRKEGFAERYSKAVINILRNIIDKNGQASMNLGK